MNAQDHAAYRFCARVLAGRAAAAYPDAGTDVVDTAVREGVSGLVHAGLHETGGAIAAAKHESLADHARQGAVRHMHALAEARRIQAALDAAGIPALWLKGIALGQWLYPAPHLREVADLDLLLPDHPTCLAAADVLAPLGYTLPNPFIAGDLIVHELLAWSERSGMELDLHWDLSNAALFAKRFRWGDLLASSISLPGLGARARGLGPAHAFLHACIHRAANALTRQAHRLRWLYDIHLLASRFDAVQWNQVTGTARELEVADACLDALRACGDAFGTPVPPDVDAHLAAAAAREAVRTKRLTRWWYWQRKTWACLPTLRLRLRWLRQLMLPDVSHLRVRYGGDGAGDATLLARRMRDGVRRLRNYHGLPK